MVENTEQKIIISIKNIDINPILVDSRDKLQKFLPFLKSNKKLGIDVEFPAMKRFKDKISLIQIGNTTKQLLIDCEQFFPNDLIQILEDQSIEKIFFDCAQDIRMIKELLRCDINNICDVQEYYKINNNLLNGIGLDKVINIYYGDIINSDQKHKFQKLDWRLRPIPTGAKEYAASDVAYLIPIRDHLIEELTSKDIMPDILRIAQSYELLEPLEEKLTNKFFEFKIASKFNEPTDKLLALRLHKLRESIAKKWNKPFFFVIGNERFSLLIQRKPLTKRELKQILSPRQFENKKLASSILSIVSQTLKDVEMDEYIFFYEFTFVKKILFTLNRKLLDILTWDDFILIGMGNTEYMNEINKKYFLLLKWRKFKANQLNVDPNLFLPLITMKKLAKWDFKVNPKPNIKGLSNKFVNEYNDELQFWISQRNVRLIN